MMSKCLSTKKQLMIELIFFLLLFLRDWVAICTNKVRVRVVGHRLHFYISVYNTVERELVDFSCKIEMLKLREVCMCKVFVTHSLFLLPPMNAFCHFS